MPTSYTSLLGLALPVTGELSGTWGDTVNDYITQYLDASVAGTQTISGSQTAVTLSKTTATSLSQAGSGATGSSQYNIINCTGNPASMLTVTVPAASKTYVVVNATSTNQDVKIVGAGPTTGVTLVAGEKAVIAWNGSDFIKIATSTADGVTTLSFGSTGLTPSTATSGAVTVAGTLVAANGGTGQSSYTTGDLLYATGSTALSKLGIGTNGQVLTSTGTAPQWSTLSGVAVTTFSAGTTGFTPSSATSGAVTLAGTLATTNGGTGLTSFTANRVFYASSTSAIGSSANLTFDGTTLTANALTTTSTVTINGGTANGVAYLNGSKVLTTGGTLTFDGTTLRTGTSSTTSPGVKINMDGGGTQTYFALTSDPLTIFSIYRPSGANNLRFDANYGGFVWGLGSAGTATEAMALTSTGLGIGTSSPAYKLDVNGSMRSVVSTGGTLLLGDSNNTTAIRSVPASGDSGIGFYTQALSGNSLRMTIDYLGNLGLGVTPSAWWSGSKAMQLGQGASIEGRTSTNIATFGSNVFVNSGGSAAYINTAAAARYVLVDGSHQWQTAPSGTAGNAISFTQAMTLDASGNLGIGTSSPATKLDTAGTIRSTSGTAPSSGTGIELLYDSGTSRGIIQVYNRTAFTYQQLSLDGSDIILRVAGTTKATLTAAGFTQPVAYADTVSALGNTGTATTINLQNANVFTATLTGNCTFTLSNAIATGSSSFTLILTNDGTAGRTVAWAGGSFVFPGGAASLSRTTTANAVDVWVFFTPNGGTTWYGNIAMKDMKA